MKVMNWIKRGRVVLGAAALAIIVWKLRGYLVQNDWRPFYQSPGRLILAISMTLLNIAAQCWIWLYLINRGGPQLDWRDGYKRYSASWISRYLPVGKLWQ